MTWNAEATIQFIGILISILGIGIACYNHKSVVAASRRLYIKACGLRPTKPEIKAPNAFELPKLHSWDDPDIEAGATTSAWAEEVTRDVETCWA